MRMETAKATNGILIEAEKDGKYYGYVVWQPSQAEIIENEFNKSGRTPTDIIKEAIEILKQEGCKTSSSLSRRLCITQPEFIVFKQAEPLANNVLKMGKNKDGDMVVWLRGKSKDSRNTDESRLVGDKTDTIVPLWATAANKIKVSTADDDYTI